MEETILIECSRQSSIEGTTGNSTSLAEWTCDCGSGIVLDIGDKITLQGGFVSEKGAEVGEIEIKERDRGITVSAVVSNEIDYREPVAISSQIPPAINTVVEGRESYDYGAEIAGNSPKNFTINDGETNIIYSPYKTSNGEFYATLPRRHIGINSEIDAALTHLNPYNLFDATSGPYKANFNTGAAGTGNVMWNLDGGNPVLVWGFDVACQFCPADYKLSIANDVNQNTGAAGGDFSRRKGTILNDNSRYTIFRAKTIYRNASSALSVGGNVRSLLGGNATNSVNYQPGTSVFQDAYDLRDPAILYDWEQVKNVITIKSKQGFNKPEDVSTELTQQLNLRGDPITKKLIYRLLASNSDTLLGEKILYTYYESPCYKGYGCATSQWDAKRWTDFKQVWNSNNAELDNAHLYMSMYQHIGIKRPDLHIVGRETNASQGFLISTTGDAKNIPINAQVLNTGLVWDETNINKLNKLFQIQGNYDELFTDVYQQGPHSNYIYFDITPGNHRFLHFNGQDEATNQTGYDAGHHRHCPVNSLGYDLYGQNASWVPPDTEGYYHYDNTMATYPIFFDYNASTVGLGVNDVGYCENTGGGTSDINQLAFGWARKIRVEAQNSITGKETFYIGLQFTKTGNGIPKFLYNGFNYIAWDGIAGNTGRRFGWDYHFSAYGNPCMVLYSGLVNSLNTHGDLKCNTEYRKYCVASSLDDHTSTRNTAAAYNKILLGADSPAIGYDSFEERFYFTNLHVSERVGNPSNAGLVPNVNGSGVVVTEGVDANTNADTPVYKINKRMLGTSYCPNVAPYSASLVIAGNATLGYPSQLMFSNNLEPWTPYDSQGGIFIEEVIVPEKYWESNLIGVMGFQYSQFTNDNTSRQITIRDRLNSSNMKFLTTQAPISVEDLLSWTKNGFGFSNFVINPALSYVRSGDSEPSQPSYERTIIPAATVELPENADSTRITALELPTKTARPYYAIRSDIIPQNNFYGGNQDLVKATAAAVNRPVVAVINKTNGYGDFYSAEFNMPVFTNTAKRVITSIKTSVHDPDGSYAKVNNSSSVIYKIIKTKNIDLTPVQTLLESKKKSDVLIGDAAASMLKDPNDAKPNYNFAFT